jgi:hypothetical protein
MDEFDPPPQLTTATAANAAVAASANMDAHTFTFFRAKDSFQRIRAPLYYSVFACVLPLTAGT